MALAARSKAFAPSAKAAAPAPRAALRVVVKAQKQQAPQQQEQQQARFQLPAAVRPALATVAANVIMAMPALADSGK